MEDVRKRVRAGACAGSPGSSPRAARPTARLGGAEWQRTLPVYGSPGRTWPRRLGAEAVPLVQGPCRSSKCASAGHTAASTRSSAASRTAGSPFYGFSWKPNGEPLDDYGRNIYVDTLDSAYGEGWYRENGFLTHRPREASVTASTRTVIGRAAAAFVTARP